MSDIPPLDEGPLQELHYRQQQDELYARAREIAQRNTLMPAYLCDDEDWYIAVETAREELGIKEKAPVCQLCGSIAPYGDERNYWIDVHKSRFHRLYWTRIRPIFRRK